MRMHRFLIHCAFLISCTVLVADNVFARELTYEDRVKAQEAIERVYYSYRTGVTRPFAEIVTRAVIESKVRTYLRQSAALAAFWGQPVSGEMLQRELERMKRGTRLPGRLRELYTALDNDPFLIRECLARPLLVDRLSRVLFASDARIHVAARRKAEATRGDLLRGAIDPNDQHPLRKKVEAFASSSTDHSGPVDDARLELGPREFAQLRSGAPAVPGEIGDVTEGPDAFVIRVVLEEEPGRVVIARYTIPKTTWDQWWSDVAGDFDPDAVTSVADSGGPLPMPSRAGVDAAVPPCEPDDTWTLMQAPDGRVDHTAIWTGSEMIVWGGGTLSVDTNSGGRYDPATDTWSATSLANAPVARYDHTAVWTGTEMIVWGGARRIVPVQFLDSGGRYDPVTNTWTSTTMTGVPQFRFRHTAVWTGSEMIVWGGNSGALQNTGGRYSPSTDSWTATSLTGAPTGRVGHTAVWTGSEMIVWGGQDSSNTFLNSGGRFDPVRNIWSAATTQINAPAARRYPTSVWTGSEMIVWGGTDAALSQLNTGGRYNPVGNSWVATATTGAPSPRADHVAVWTGDRMIVWGGGALVSTGGRYDPANDTWTATRTIGAPAGRTSPTAVWTGTEMIVWGGWGGSSVLDTGGRYNPAADTWQAITNSNPPPGRRSHTAVWTGAEMIVWGGHDDTDTVNTGGRFDPMTGSWTATSTTNAPASRWNHTAVWTGTEMIIWGGSTLATPGSRYDPVANRWTTMSTVGAPEVRWLHTAVWTGTEMIVWGGGTTPLNTGGRYDPRNDSWTLTSTANAPAPRYEHSAVWTGTEMIVWGGRAGGTSNDILDTGGRYHPVTDTWTATSTTLAPLARTNHTAVWTGSVMVVWGGTGNSVGNTGGRYSPSMNSWTATSTVNAPTARDAHAVVWTGHAMIVWGGERYVGMETEYLQTGGRFDPIANSWSATAPESAPSGRTLHTAIWTGNQMIVWGGRGATGILDSGGTYSLGHAVDDDGDGFSECTGDCDDLDINVYPGAPGICDGLNNNCSSPSWPGTVGTEESDDDGDDITECAGDCDDTRATVYPGAPPACNGLNDDCSDPSWPMPPADESDLDGDGWRRCSGDCNDADPTVHPGATETCNGFDDDCDGVLDEGCDTACDNPEKAAPETNLTEGSVAAVNGRLVWNGSGYGLAWSDRRDGNAEIYFARFDSSTSKVGGDLRVTNAAGTSDNPWIVWTGSAYGIAWEDSRDGYPAIYFVRVDATGDKLGTERAVVAALTGSVRTPRLVWNGFEYGLFWNDNRNGYWQNVFRTIDASGSVLGTPRAVDNQGYDSGPCQAAWNGSGYMVTNNRLGDTEIYIVRLDAEGGILAAEQRVTYLAGVSRSPSIIWNGSEYGLFWIDNNFGDNQVFYARLAADGTKIGGDVPLMPVSGSLPLHSVAWTGSGYGVAWIDVKDGNSEAYFRRIDTSGMALAPEVRITSDPALTQAPSLQWTGSGFGVAFVDARLGSNAVFGARIACCPDADGDGWTTCAGDCNDADPTVWTVPGEALSLQLSSDQATLMWSAPSLPGGTSPLYDMLRSPGGSDFSATAMCLETAGSDTQSADPAVPPLGGAYHYLVRARNSCGAGTLGQRSTGDERVGRACP